MLRAKSYSVLPGYNLVLGYTLLYLSIIVLIPLAAVFVKASEFSLAEFWAGVTADRVVASYKLSFGASLLAAIINMVFGLMLAWALVRYTFPGKKIVGATLLHLMFSSFTAPWSLPLQAAQQSICGRVSVAR